VNVKGNLFTKWVRIEPLYNEYNYDTRLQQHNSSYMNLHYPISKNQEQYSRLPLFFYVEYNGKFFSGWQKQKNSLSVSQAIAEKFQIFFQDNAIVVYGASRTDSGVHACRQAAIVYLSCEDHEKIMKSPSLAQKLLTAVNSMLRGRIRILALAEVAPDFYIRSASKSKSYIYFLSSSLFSSPFHQHIWELSGKFDFKKFEQLIHLFKGKHDFFHFAKHISLAGKNSERTITSVRLVRKGEVRIVLFRGNGFLHHQIRMMVGTCVQIAKNYTFEEGANILQSLLQRKDDSFARFTAPAHALFLHRVHLTRSSLLQMRWLVK